VLARQGRIAEAIEHYGRRSSFNSYARHTIIWAPRLPAGHTAEAIEQFQTALSFSLTMPMCATVWEAAGLGRPAAEAMAHFQKPLTSNRLCEAHNDWAFCWPRKADG